MRERTTRSGSRSRRKPGTAIPCNFGCARVGQTAGGKIEVFDDHVQLEVTLPWLLGKFAEKLAPAIRKEGALMLEKK